MARQGLYRKRLAMFLGVAVVASVIAFAADAAGILTSQEQSTVDVRFAIRGNHSVPNDIVLVPIDDVTFNDLDVRWPFPRHFHAEVINALRKAGAKVIAYDVQFTEQTDARNDNALINAVVPATSCSPRPRSTRGDIRRCSEAMRCCASSTQLRAMPCYRPMRAE
jgi:CHASE2 domain-containing sensor protein